MMKTFADVGVGGGTRGRSPEVEAGSMSYSFDTLKCIPIIG